ncbi:MAG: hypothetical protein MOGMAGMI_02231 [Candidatus Omnitrophica bacterium]|nr:hypothetical protein [Candidatus Omnitrophota bacterium]
MDRNASGSTVFSGRRAAVWTEPYRLLFLFGMLMGLHGIGHWMAYGLGWKESYPVGVHAVIQTRLFMGAYIAGFLMTAVPRFSATGPSTRSEVLSVLGLLTGLYTALELGAWKWVAVIEIAWVLTLARFIVKRLGSRSSGAPRPPVEFVWLPVAFASALAGSLIQLIGLERPMDAFWTVLAKLLWEKGFLLSVVLGVGGFLGPRLMGSQRQPDPQEMRRSGPPGGASVLAQIAGGVSLFAGLALEAAGHAQVAAGVLALTAAALMLRSRSLVAAPPVRSAFTWSMAVSFWAVLAGLVLPALLPVVRSVVVHVLFLGGFSLMTLTVSAMVVMSHGGRGDRIHGSGWFFGTMLTAHLTALACRLYAAADPERYFLWVAASAAFWLVAACVWIGSAARLVFRLPRAGDGHGHHERGAAAC